jgi:imidazolonepropionase-like amidohydrolase
MILLKNGLVYTVDKEESICDVFIDGGKIVEIGDGIEARGTIEIIDCTGKIVMPGFIDAHCHLSMWEDGIGFEGADGNEMTDPVTPHMRAIDGMNPMDRTFEEAREGGVTSAAVGPGSGNVVGGTFTAVKTYGKKIDDMIIKDPIAMKCAFGENPKRVYNEKKQMPMTRMGTAALLRKLLFDTVQYNNKLKAFESGESKARPEHDMKLEAMLPVIRKEIPLKAHAHRADDIFTSIRIAKEFDVLLTLEHCTEGHLIAEELAELGYPAVVGPSFGDRPKYELKHKTFRTPGVLSKAGVKIAIMTDSPVIPLEHLPMCAGFAVKEGLDETEALKAITIYAAEIIGIEDRVGSLTVGKDADIVIWDKHPFALDAKVDTTIIDGRVVYSKR